MTQPLPSAPPPRNQKAQEIARKAYFDQMRFNERMPPDRIGQRPAPLASVMAMYRAGVPVGKKAYDRWNFERQFPITVFGDNVVRNIPQA